MLSPWANKGGHRPHNASCTCCSGTRQHEHLHLSLFVSDSSLNLPGLSCRGLMASLRRRAGQHLPHVCGNMCPHVRHDRVLRASAQSFSGAPECRRLLPRRRPAAAAEGSTRSGGPPAAASPFPSPWRRGAQACLSLARGRHPYRVEIQSIFLCHCHDPRSATQVAILSPSLTT